MLDGGSLYDGESVVDGDSDSDELDEARDQVCVCVCSAVVNHILDLNNGDIKGKKIALVYHNSAYGKEPIRTLEVLAEKHGFELTKLAVDHPGQEQKSQWLQIRRERPDYVTMWGWGVMNQVALPAISPVPSNANEMPQSLGI